MEKDLRNLIIKGPFVMSNEKYYRIYKKTDGKKEQKSEGERGQKQNNTHFTIVTPQICLSSLNIDHGFISLSIDDIKSDSKITIITRSIKHLETCLQNQRKCMSIPKKCVFRSCVNDWYGNLYLKCKLYQKQVSVYDFDGNIDNKGLSKLTRGSIVKVLMWIKGVYINKDYWGIQLVVLQIRVYDLSPPQECVIIDDDIAQKDIPVVNMGNDVLGKYRQMLNIGVPEPAIRQRMIMDSVNPDLLNGGKSLSKPMSSCPKINPVSLLNGLGSINLKKAEVRSLNPKKPSRSHNNQLVPSLEDILRIRNRLNSVKKPKDHSV